MATEEAGAEVESDDLPDVPEQSAAPEAASAAPETAPVSASPLDAFRQMPGLQSASDEEIVARLQETVQREHQTYRALQQYQQIVPAASEYLSNREMYQQWKQSQSQPQQAPAPAAAAPPEEKWWNPPQVRDVYRQYLTRDEQGREVISENAPLEARHALAEYQAYKADFARKFLEDPQQALGPMVEKIVAGRAQEIAEAQIATLKEEQFVQQIEAQNRDWLYDENGNVSREGLLVQKYIEDAKGYGINGAQARWDYATAMVERDLALANLQASQMPQAPVAPQPQPVAPAPAPAQQPSAAQKNMDFLRQQAKRTAPRRSSNPESRSPQRPMTFADRMVANLRKSGMSDE